MDYVPLQEIDRIDLEVVAKSREQYAADAEAEWPNSPTSGGGKERAVLSGGSFTFKNSTPNKSVASKTSSLRMIGQSMISTLETFTGVCLCAYLPACRSACLSVCLSVSFSLTHV